MKFPNINIPAIFVKSYGQARPFDSDLLKAFQDVVINLKGLLNNGLSFADNMDACLVSVTSHGTPGTEFSVTHTLNRKPVGYIVTGKEAAGSVYDGATSWSNTLLYLKSDLSSKKFRLLIF